MSRVLRTSECTIPKPTKVIQCRSWPSGIVMVGKNAQDTEIQPDETRTMGMNHWRAGETFRGTEMTFKWIFAIWER